MSFFSRAAFFSGVAFFSDVVAFAVGPELVGSQSESWSSPLEMICVSGGGEGRGWSEALVASAAAVFSGAALNACSELLGSSQLESLSPSVSVSDSGD